MMHFLSLSMALLAGLVSALPAIQHDSRSSSPISARANTTRTISQTSGLSFTFDDVVTPYYAGTNSYWIGFLTSNADIDGVMVELATAGIKVLRVWGFNDVVANTTETWFQSFIPGSDPVINTGSTGLERLDYVVKSAETNGIKLIVNFVNNWSDYGGMPAYNTYYNTTKTTWYTDTTVQAQYQAYIKAVVTRYPSSPSIFAWELANEPRCNGCDTSIITNWITATAAYIKSIDPDHMVTLGDEGFGLTSAGTEYPYTAGEGLDFAANLNISDIDFGTFHLYPDSWGGLSNEWGNGWIEAHAAACKAANKPCILEEYGVPTTNRTAVEGMWQATSLGAEGMAGDMFWQLGTTLASGTKTDDDGNTIYVGDSDWEVLVVEHIATIDVDVSATSNSSESAASIPSTASVQLAIESATPSISNTTIPTTDPVESPIVTSSTAPMATTDATTLPEETSNPSVTPSASATIESSTPYTNSTTSTGSVEQYGQCGGSSHTGSTACVSGTTCTVMNTFYLQCI